MSDLNFLTIKGHQSLSSEMAFVLFELDHQFFPTPWSLQDWRALQEQDRLLVILRSEESVVGFCLFNISVADSFAHLLKILIVPECRSKGLAQKLLINALGQLQDEGCTHYFLEVEEDNYAAQKLYSSLGFKSIHRKKDFYGSNRSALIMTK